MGAATVVHDANTGAAELAPEPSAQNNRLDLQARYLVITPSRLDLQAAISF